MVLDPLLVKKLKRFRSIRRGYYSFLLFTGLCLLSLVLEVLVSNRALVVHYQGEFYFPSYGAVIPGQKFGLEYEYETNYRQLQKLFENQGGDDWVLMPLVPYNPLEIDIFNDEFPPQAPDFERQHYLGTDAVGRDVLARLSYGFRMAIAFSLLVLLASYVIGIAIGSAMGYFGGWFDLLIQRLIEIWNNVPFLYVIIIVSSVIEPTLLILVGIMVAFRWTSMTWYMRTETYREKSREYVMAAKTLGASTPRIIFKHTLPNSLAVIVTFVPFAVHEGMSALVALDFLGFGVAPPAPSWGELMSQGIEHLDSQWIITSVITAMVVVLTMVTFIGEAMREAFDPKKYTTYE